MLMTRPQRWPTCHHPRPPSSPPPTQTGPWRRAREKLTKKSVVPVIIRQEPLVNGTHQEVVRQARGLGPHQEEARGDVDGLAGDGDKTQVLPRLAEP